MTGVRLAFRCGVWKPSAAEWVLAMSSVQPEEHLRIRRFVFRKHTRSALVSSCGPFFTLIPEMRRVFLHPARFRFANRDIMQPTSKQLEDENNKLYFG